MLDDEDTSVTAGSIVTVSVRLVRGSMEDLLGQEVLQEDSSKQLLQLEEDLQGQDEEEQNEGQVCSILICNSNKCINGCLGAGNFVFPGTGHFTL